MTERLLSNPNNKLVDTDTSDVSDIRFRSKTGKWLTPKRDERIDYGLIVGIHPEQSPEKTWIASVGLGEFGTSAAANFLAFSWWKILDRIATSEKRSDMATFACIVKAESALDADDGAIVFNFAVHDDQ